MFGRKKKTHDDEIDEVEALPRLSDEDADIWSEPGPRNYGDVDTSEGYVDMGAILFPARPGMQLRTQVADDGTTVLQILVVVCLLFSSEHSSTLHRALGAHGIAVGIHVVELRGMVDEEAL